MMNRDRLRFVSVVLLTVALCGCGGAATPNTRHGDCHARDTFNASTITDLAIVFPDDTTRAEIGDLVNSLMFSDRAEGDPDSRPMGIDSVDVDYSRSAVFIDVECNADDAELDEVEQFLRNLAPGIEVRRFVAPKDLD